MPRPSHASRSCSAGTTDGNCRRGYGEAKADANLTGLGVKFVTIIRTGCQSAARQAVERNLRFRKLIKWRTGSEGEIATLKRGYGWGRSFMDSLSGRQVWCGYGIFAHNSQKIRGLVADKRLPAKGPGPPEKRPKPVGNGLPPRSGPPGVLPIHTRLTRTAGSSCGQKPGMAPEMEPGGAGPGRVGERVPPWAAVLIQSEPAFRYRGDEITGK